MTTDTTTEETTPMRFVRTIITYEVLSEGDLGSLDLDELHHAVTEGDCSGRTLSERAELIDRRQVIAYLQAQGSDGNFLFSGEEDSCEECGVTLYHDTGADEWFHEDTGEVACGAPEPTLPEEDPGPAEIPSQPELTLAQSLAYHEAKDQAVRALDGDQGGEMA